MNRYRHFFVVECPNNGIKVGYDLLIETYDKVLVEDIVDGCSVGVAFHEDLADALHARFGGRQTMTAFHHGVRIETVRGDV